MNQEALTQLEQVVLKLRQLDRDETQAALDDDNPSYLDFLDGKEQAYKEVLAHIRKIRDNKE